jgi:hypothetical protein
MNTEQPTVQVQANWDQVSRCFAIRNLNWKLVNPLQPNRVVVKCDNLAEGKFLYNLLRGAKFVALKNWL